MRRSVRSSAPITRNSLPTTDGTDARLTVVGGGSWGTALAIVLARGGSSVQLVVRRDEQAEKINRERRNPDYLREIMLPPSIHATTDLEAALDRSQCIIYALPCGQLPDLLPTIRARTEPTVPVIAACKGLHEQSGLRVDEMLVPSIGADRALLLSGPSFADEVATGMPTAITLAATRLELARQVAPFFRDTGFRIYPHDDLTGVALGGALKNIIAIAAGIADGLGLGHNAMAALVTRGIQEMTRLARACGAQPETLYGLSGLGDLVLTCNGGLSRNRRMGRALAEGMDAAEARRHVGQVVEGEKSARMARRLAEQHGIETPIISAVCRVLDGDWSCRLALQSLLTRPERAEFL